MHADHQTSRVNIRIANGTKAAAQEMAAREGVSLSVFIRQAILMRISWDSALRAVEAGANPTELRNYTALKTVLDRIAQELGETD